MSSELFLLFVNIHKYLFFSFQLAGILVPFYSVFLFNELTASVLLAHGRLDLLFIAAVIGKHIHSYNL